MRALVYNWDLISNLVSRDIKLHYRGSFLGILWSQINPLMSVIIFTIVFEKVVPLGIANYPAYVFSGLLAWNWLASSLSNVGYSLKSNRELLRKPSISSEVIVVAAVASNLVNFLLSMPVLFGLLLVNGLPLGLSLLYLPVIIGIEFMFILGLAFIISASSVFFYDVLHLVGVVIGVWFYITPIFYRPGATLNGFELVYNLNPMNHVVQAYRKILLSNQVPDLLTLLWLLLLSATIGLAGLWYFRRLKYSFVDVL